MRSANFPLRRFLTSTLLLIAVVALIVGYVVFRTFDDRVSSSLQHNHIDHLSIGRHEPAVQRSVPSNIAVERQAKPTPGQTFEVQRRLSWYAGFISQYHAQGKDVRILTAALINRMQSMSDFVAAARTRGFDERHGNLSSAYTQFKAAEYARFDEDLSSAIGEEEIAELRRYEEKLPERAVVAELISRLRESGDLLDSAVEKQVVEMLWLSREPDGQRKEIGHSAVPDSDMPPFAERVIPASVFDRLTGILSIQELARLHQIYDEQQRLGHLANRE